MKISSIAGHASRAAGAPGRSTPRPPSPYAGIGRTPTHTVLRPRRIGGAGSTQGPRPGRHAREAALTPHRQDLPPSFREWRQRPLLAAQSRPGPNSAVSRQPTRPRRGRRRRPAGTRHRGSVEEQVGEAGRARSGQLRFELRAGSPRSGQRQRAISGPPTTTTHDPERPCGPTRFAASS